MKLNDTMSLKLVYELAEELKNDPSHIAEVQALTLDKTKPFGLKGKYGLFGSTKWWKNLKKGKLTSLHLTGVIERVFSSGQGNGEINCFDLSLDGGGLHTESIFVNDNADKNLFKVGSKVEIFYALDQLKMQPSEDGGINYSHIVVEMAVSKL